MVFPSQRRRLHVKTCWHADFLFIAEWAGSDDGVIVPMALVLMALLLILRGKINSDHNTDDCDDNADDVCHEEEHDDDDDDDDEEEEHDDDDDDDDDDGDDGNDHVFGDHRGSISHSSDDVIKSYMASMTNYRFCSCYFNDG